MTATPESAELPHSTIRLIALAEKLEGPQCLVSADDRAIAAAACRLAAKPDEEGVREALNALSIWCSEARHAIGAVDGYDYRSGEEFGIRCVEIEIDRRAKALSTTGQPKL